MFNTAALSAMMPQISGMINPQQPMQTQQQPNAFSLSRGNGLAEWIQQFMQQQQQPIQQQPPMSQAIEGLQPVGSMSPMGQPFNQPVMQQPQQQPITQQQPQGLGSQIPQGYQGFMPQQGNMGGQPFRGYMGGGMGNQLIDFSGGQNPYNQQLINRGMMR